MAGILPEWRRPLRLMQGQVPDPYIANVVLLLNFTGSSIVDLSPASTTITTVNSPVLSAEQTLFGNKTLKFTGTNYLTATIVNGLGSSGTWTLEYWMHKTVDSGYVFSNIDNASLRGLAMRHDARTLGTLSTGYFGSVIPSSIVLKNAWHHLAFVKSSGSIKNYIDGIYNQSGSTYYESTNTAFCIGSSVYDPISAGDGGLQGYLGPLRLTQNVARYSSNFAVPTAPFPDA